MLATEREIPSVWTLINHGPKYQNKRDSGFPCK